MKSFPLSLLGSAGGGQSIRVSVIFLLVTVMLFQSMILVTPEIIDLGMDMIIDASSDEVHFIRGFLRAPASIDLSNIRWITNEAIVFEFGDDNTVIDDIYNDLSYETIQPSFFNSETDPSSLEEIVKDDFAIGEEIEDENDGDEGDFVEEGKSDGDSGNPFNSTSSSEDKEPQSVADANSEPPTLSTEMGAEKQGEDLFDENAEVVTTEAEINYENNETFPEDQNQVIEVEDGETEIETEEEHNDGEELSPETQSGLGDSIGNDEAGGDIGNNGNEDDAGEELVPDTSSEDKNQKEGDHNDAEELSPDNPVFENDSDGSEDIGEEIGNNIDEDEAGEQPSTKGQVVDDPFPMIEDKNKVSEEPTSTPTSEAGGDRTLQDKNNDFSSTVNQVVDIALFLIPENGQKDKWGNYDWVSLGVGSYDDEMLQGMSYCCSKDTAFREVCKSNDVGTLMIDEKKI